MIELNDNNFELTIKKSKKPVIVLFLRNNKDNLNNITIKNNIKFLEDYSKNKINFYYVISEKNPFITQHLKHLLKNTDKCCFVCSIKKYKDENVIEDIIIDIQPLIEYIKIVNNLLNIKMPEELQKLFDVNENGEYIYYFNK